MFIQFENRGMAELAFVSLFRDYGKDAGISVSWASMPLENRIPFLLLLNGDEVRNRFGLSDEHAVFEKEHELLCSLSVATLKDAARGIVENRTGMNRLNFWVKNELTDAWKQNTANRFSPLLPPYGCIDFSRNPELMPEQLSLVFFLDSQAVDVGAGYSLSPRDPPSNALCCLVFCRVWRDNPPLLEQARQDLVRLREDVRMANQGLLPHPFHHSVGIGTGTGAGAGAGAGAGTGVEPVWPPTVAQPPLFLSAQPPLVSPSTIQPPLSLPEQRLQRVEQQLAVQLAKLDRLEGLLGEAVAKLDMVCAALGQAPPPPDPHPPSSS